MEGLIYDIDFIKKFFEVAPTLYKLVPSDTPVPLAGSSPRHHC